MAFGKQRKCGQVPELGAIFMSNRATMEMCFSWKIFGLPYSRASFVKQIKAGMFLFLFEHETRKLHGVYQACSDGAMNFSSEAFSSSGNKYPAQVKIRVLWHCKPLYEDEFRPAIKDNYFAAYKFNFGLSRNQVRELLWLFHSRKLRGGLLLEEMLPNDPFLIRGATRSCSIVEAGEIFTVGVQNGNVPENANALEPNRDLEKISMPNRELCDSLLIEGDSRDNAIEEADFNLPFNNINRELFQQGRFNQVRDRMDYGCKLNNDYELNSQVPYMSCDDRYDPDIPLFNNMKRFHEYGRVYTDNTVDAQNITRQIHVSPGMHHDACDSSLNPLSYYCNSVPKIGVEMDVNELGQSSATCYFEPSSYNPNSGTSRQGRGRCFEIHVKPDFFKDSNNSISGELLKPPSEKILLPSEVDDASILRQRVAYYDPSQTISHHGDALVHCSTAGQPVDINQDSKVCKERQPVPQKKQSVFSRLKPALDNDDECELKDPQKSIDDMVKEVMESLSGHYHQLVKESNMKTKHVDDGDNKSKIEKKMKKPQTFQSEAANYEPDASLKRVLDVSTANKEHETQSGGEIIRETPCLNFKRRSEMHTKRNAAEGGLGEMCSAILAEKPCKRRKLVRPSLSEKKLSNKYGMLDNISENLSLSCQPLQIGSLNTDVPLSHYKEQNPPETGNLRSVVLATSVGAEFCNGQSGSSNLSDGSADINMGSDAEQHEGQSLSKQLNLRSAVLVVSNKNETGGSLKDPEFPVDFETNSCTLQLNLNMPGDAIAETFMMFNGDHKNHVNTVCCDLNVDVDVGVSTKLELCGALNVAAADLCVDAGIDDDKQHIVSVTEVGNDRSGKSFESGGSQHELRNDLDMYTDEDKKDELIMGRDELSEEAMYISLLAEEISANCQASKV